MVRYFDGRCWTVVFGKHYGRQEAKALKLKDAEALAKRIMTRTVMYGIGRKA